MKGGTRGENNSYYHFRVDTLDDENIVKMSKFHFTIKQMEKEYQTSNCCLYNLLSKENHVPRALHLKKLKFFRVKQPTRVYVDFNPVVTY